MHFVATPLAANIGKVDPGAKRPFANPFASLAPSSVTINFLRDVTRLSAQRHLG